MFVLFWFGLSKSYNTNILILCWPRELVGHKIRYCIRTERSKAIVWLSGVSGPKTELCTKVSQWAWTRRVFWVNISFHMFSLYVLLRQVKSFWSQVAVLGALVRQRAPTSVSAAGSASWLSILGTLWRRIQFLSVSSMFSRLTPGVKKVYIKK